MRAIVLLFAVLLAAGITYSIDVSTCSIINSAGVYNLTADLSGGTTPVPGIWADFTCILVNTSNVVFDCNGHMISNAAPPSSGIAYAAIFANSNPSSAISNVTVRNCPHIENYTTGIYYDNVSSGSIYSNNIYEQYVSANGEYGIRCDYCSNIAIHDNYMVDGYSGILVWGTGTANRIYQNTFVDSRVYAINIESSYTNVTDNVLTSDGSLWGIEANSDAIGSRIENNNVSGVELAGFYLSSDYLIVRNNRVTNSRVEGGDAFSITGDYNTVTQNYAYNASSGFSIFGVGTNATNNNATLNENNGFTIGGDSIIVNYSYSRNNGGAGFYVSGDHVILRYDVSEGNGGNGFTTRLSSYDLLTNNTAQLNGGDGFLVNDTVLGGGGPIDSYNNITNSVSCNNTGYAFHLDGTDNDLLANNTGCNSSVGFYAEDSYSNTLRNNTAYGNVGEGFYFTNMTGDTVTFNTARNNGAAGIAFISSSGETVQSNLAYLNAHSGITASSSSGIAFFNNSAWSNTFDGFGMSFSSGLSLTNNTAFFNHDCGMDFDTVNLSALSNNAAYQNNGSGIVLFNEANYNNMTDNLAYSNNRSGIEVYSGSYNRLVSNDAYQNIMSGIIVHEYKSTVPTNGNVLITNLAYINDYGITLGSGSTNTTSTGDAPYNNRVAEMLILDTQNATITNGDFSGNAYDVAVEGQVGGSFRMIYAMLGEPGGSVVNMTNLSVTDTITSADNYTLNWTSRADAPTINWHTFHNRFVNISDLSGTSSIDRVEWDWLASEATGFNENNLALWKYNSSGWTLMNNSPNTSANTLSLFSLRPNSDYAIFEYVENCPVINTSGTFTMSNSYNGSTNAVYLPMGGAPQYACVRINVSNVIFDCNGYSINGNLSSGATAGIVAESGAFYSPRISNITIRNCPMIRGYAAGVVLYNASDSLITNVTAKNNTLSGATGFMLYHSPNVNLTNTLAENHTYNYYINLNSDNVRITNSTARTSSTYGFMFSSSVQNGYITDSNAINNNFTGILMDGSGYPYVARNNVSNSGAYTADTGITISSNNALVEDNTATGAVSTPSSSWGYGFVIETNNVTFRRNLAYGNKIGIEAFGSGCNLTNNTARNNLQDGFAFYSDGDTIAANDAFQNGMNGFAFNYTEGATIIRNRAFSNTLDGYHMAEGSEDNLFSGNNATENGENGFYLETSPNNTLNSNAAFGNPSQGFYLVESDSNTLGSNVANASNSCFRTMNSTGTSLTGDIAENCSYRGFFFQYSNGTTATGCRATNCFHSGFETDRSAGGSFTGLVSEGGQYGFVMWTNSDNTNVTDSVFDTNDGVSVSAGIYAYNSRGVRLTNVSLNTNDPQGLLIENNADVRMDGGAIYNNTQYGAKVVSSNSTFNGVHFYDNGADFMVNGTGITVNMTGVVFDNPSGNYQNFTNLSINDTVASAYSVTWLNNASLSTLPPDVFSFAQKFVNITPISGNVSIDSIAWNWLDSELTGYNEALFAIYNLNNGTWTDPGADLFTGSNMMSLDDVTLLEAFAMVQLIPSDGGETTDTVSEPYSVSIDPACQGFIVTVKDAGTPVPDAMVTGTDNTHASELMPHYTNASGQAYFPDCDIDVSVKAAKSGRSGTDSGMAGCGFCPECASDGDCSLSEQCSSSQCVPVNCPKGIVVNHACELFECMTDKDCPVGQSCVNHTCMTVYECDYGLANTTEDDDADCADNEYCDVPVGQPGGSCKPVEGCGAVANHVLTQWECGDQSSCPSCPEGEQCVAHECKQSDLTCPASGIVGDKKTCKATEDNQPCVNCDYIVTDPTGKNVTGKTDGEGNLNLPLNLAGNYKIALLKDGETIKAIFVKALPQSQPVEPEKPTSTGMDPLLGGLFLVILLAAGLIAILYWRRKGDKKKPEGKK